MCVVPILRLVLHVSRRDRDPALSLFRCLVDLIKRDRVAPILLRLRDRDRCRQRRLPVVDVPDRSHVYVRLRALEFGFSHRSFPRDPPTSPLSLRKGPSATTAIGIDDLFGLALRYFLVVRELHRVNSATLTQRAQVVAYPNISPSGTLAPMTWASPRSVIPPTLPRRDERSPMMSPM